MGRQPEHRRELRFARGVSGFTLLELLMVVAIIGILAGLTTAGLSRSKAVAKRTQCMSNLRQIGIGFTMYVGDHDVYPADLVDFGNSIAPYCIFTNFPAPPGVLAPDYSLLELAKRRFFLCPATPPSAEAGYVYNRFGSGGYPRVRMGLPTLGLHDDPEIFLRRKRLAVSKVKVPSDMIAFGEIGAYPLDVYAQTLYPNLYFWFKNHKDGANVVFCDGHVEFATKRRNNRDNDAMRRRWNNDNEPHSEYWDR